MRNAEHVSWLHRELPELVSQGIIGSEVGARIQNYYGEPEIVGGTAKRWALVVFGIFGALLIGGGIILLLAHNWEQLTRPMRAVISILPLMVAAALGAWIIWTERISTAWREGVGTAQALAIGSSIALVSQTYNLGGRFDEFMLTWSLLALPISYLLGATLPALLYLVGIVVWVGSVANQAGTGLWYFPLVAAVLPFIWQTGRTNRYHPRPILLLWALAITVSFGTGFSLERAIEELDVWPVVYGGVFTVLFLTGSRWWGEASSFRQRPLQNIGALGLVGLALVLSFADAWRIYPHLWSRNVSFDMAAMAIFPTAALFLWVQALRRRAWSEGMLGTISILAPVGWIAALSNAEAISAALINLYLFVLGIGTLVSGFRSRRLGTVNAGMAVLSAGILCRFFDSDLDFVMRGLAFIGLGIGFLTTNMMLLRRKGALNG